MEKLFKYEIIINNSKISVLMIRFFGISWLMLFFKLKFVNSFLNGIYKTIFNNKRLSSKDYFYDNDG